jgi:hypothetical protein
MAATGGPRRRSGFRDRTMKARAAAIVIRVDVKPKARVSALEEKSPGVWHARLLSPPVDGKANDELVALVARRFGCRKACVTIRSGASARTKLVRIEAD